jgi:hypothetical protein
MAVSEEGLPLLITTLLLLIPALLLLISPSLTLLLTISLGFLFIMLGDGLTDNEEGYIMEDKVVCKPSINISVSQVDEYFRYTLIFCQYHPYLKKVIPCYYLHRAAL